MPMSISTLLGSVGLGSAAPILEAAGVDLAATAPEALAAYAIGNVVSQFTTGNSLAGNVGQIFGFGGKKKKSSRRRTSSRRTTKRRRR